MSITSNLRELRASIPEGVELVAVSKFHPVEALQEAYAAGQRVFGESRAQELAAKAPQMPADVVWHFIGHLQTNKVRSVIPHASLIHSIDSEHLLRAVSDEALRQGRRTGVLMQLHVAREETKYGFLPDELLALLTSSLIGSLPGVEIRGVMGMASNTDDDERVRRDFAEIHAAFRAIKDGVMRDNPRFNIISMGMSHDWPIAVAEGATMIRVGTTIFGEREY